MCGEKTGKIIKSSLRTNFIGRWTSRLSLFLFVFSILFREIKYNFERPLQIIYRPFLWASSEGTVCINLGVDGQLRILATISLQGLFGREQEAGGNMQYPGVHAEGAIHKINLS